MKGFSAELDGNEEQESAELEKSVDEQAVLASSNTGKAYIVPLFAFFTGGLSKHSVSLSRLPLICIACADPPQASS